MLAAFNKSVVDAPQELVSPPVGADGGSDLRKTEKQLADIFVSTQPQTTSFTLGPHGFMAYTHHKEGLLMPRYGFLFLYSVFSGDRMYFLYEI
jgi:hypothetical protein